MEAQPHHFSRSIDQKQTVRIARIPKIRPGSDFFRHHFVIIDDAQGSPEIRDGVLIAFIEWQIQETRVNVFQTFDLRVVQRNQKVFFSHLVDHVL
ncbi:hypothetical protein SDC9_96714 [bioreactor metagenome]|uniref:Uncharacterized protein n=1 Tax=bioreactor metagenome TaxID=1076179 RepID=A0A645A9V4_9ZZZZ